MMTALERVNVLCEAMPYIQAYNKKTVVVKYGGAAMESEELRDAVISDLILLTLVGIRVVVVHGGGPEINALLSRLGVKPKFIDGLRYTDEDTMDAVQMTLCGKVGKNLAAAIHCGGGKAIGLSGLDGGLFMAVKRKGEHDWGLVGDLITVNPAPVELALSGGYIPVVSTVAQGADGASAYNINADTAASALAAALAAEKLLLLTDVPGLLRDAADPSSLISECRLSEIAGFAKAGVITKGMIPKTDCCVTALRRGVRRAAIIDGRVPHSILVELLSDHGVGTQITQG